MACASDVGPRPVTVLLVDLTPVVSDLLREMIDSDPGSMAAHVLGPGAPLGVEIDRLGARFMITPAPLAPELSERLGRVLAQHPKVTVLGIGSAGACLYELRPHPVPIGDLSAELLLALIRSADESF